MQLVPQNYHPFLRSDDVYGLDKIFLGLSRLWTCAGDLKVIPTSIYFTYLFENRNKWWKKIFSFTALENNMSRLFWYFFCCSLQFFENSIRSIWLWECEVFSEIFNRVKWRKIFNFWEKMTVMEMNFSFIAWHNIITIYGSYTRTSKKMSIASWSSVCFVDGDCLWNSVLMLSRLSRRTYVYCVLIVISVTLKDQLVAEASISELDVSSLWAM